MSTILDKVTGGLLPHVYCKKVTLERNSNDSSKTDVTLLLELYQNKASLANSSWLNNLSTQNVNFLDSIFIQVVPLSKSQNVNKLLPSTQPLVEGGNIYTAKKYYVDDYLPRGGIDEQYKARDTGLLFTGAAEPPAPMQVSNSSILGNIAGTDALSQTVSEGKVREEVIDGAAYYVLPFEYKYVAFDEKSDENSLGFVFYTFIHVPFWIQNLNIDGNTLDSSLYEDFFEQFVVESPVNTEVVFINGEVVKEREAFFMPGGEIWEGPVHLHATNINPSPSGYHGDGGISGAPTFNENGDIIDSGGEYRGWMVGETHAEDAAKLRLARVPNNKISDFRSALFAEPLDTALGLGTQTEVFNLSEPVSNILESFVSPFQKQTRKDLLVDSDTEYSKLYISRDKDNNARGMFYLDIKEMLKNNSSLFDLLTDDSKESAVTLSKLLELKVYRDRVKERQIGMRYENYSNDEAYEEPSMLVGTISDKDAYKTPKQSFSLSEITGLPYEKTKRYFMVTDTDVGQKISGKYQYRLEVRFKDGTYEHLYSLYKKLADMKILAEAYYDLSVSSYPSVSNSNFSFNSNTIPENYKKSLFRPYFSNGSYEPEFLSKAYEQFPDSESRPWVAGPILMAEMINAFDSIKFDLPTVKSSFDLTGMLDPTTGSPKGIDFFISVINAQIKKIQSLLSSTRINKTGSELDSKSVPNNYTFNNMLDIVVSPSDATIVEYHSFDHPNELFEASSNENIYVDYLSIASPLVTGFTGVRSLSTDYYKTRCFLESAKYTQLAKVEDNFNNAQIGTYEGDGSYTSDTLARTGYTFLSPSIVEISDPLEDTEVFSFYYTSFASSATNYVNKDPNAEPDAPSVLYSEYFSNLKNYDKLFISLKNYSLNKKNGSKVVLADAHAGGEDINDVPIEVVTLKEPYKRLFEEFGMTLHDIDQHDIFFDKEAGPVSEEVAVEFRDEPLGLESYSDGLVFAKTFFDDFLYSSEQKFLNLKMNSVAPKTFDVSLPNSFKMLYVRGNRIFNNKPDILQETMVPYFTPDGSTANNSLLYFNINLTAKIEVFRGTVGNAKNDEDSWSNLVKSDLQLVDGQKLFCRMSLYDESLKREIEIPMLDRYFLIYNNATNQLPPITEQTLEQEEFTDPGPGFWESQNQKKLKDFITMTEKGMMKSGQLPAMPPYEEIYGPDPDPSSQGAGPPGPPGLPGAPGIPQVPGLDTPGGPLPGGPGGNEPSGPMY